MNLLLLWSTPLILISDVIAWLHVFFYLPLNIPFMKKSNPMIGWSGHLPLVYDRCPSDGSVLI